MSTPAYAALQKQVAILTKGKALSGLNLRMLEIALEGMNVPRDRIQAQLRTAIQLGRDMAIARREAQKGGNDEAP